MSGFLGALVHGDDACGPVNPLAALTKGIAGEGGQLGRDRFIPLAGSSSSSNAFRSIRSLQPHETGADIAARAFFEQQPQSSSSTFNFHALNHALPRSSSASPAPQIFQQHQQPASAVPAWAADFMAADHQPQLSQRAWEKSRVQESLPAPAWANDFQRTIATASPIQQQMQHAAPISMGQPVAYMQHAGMMQEQFHQAQALHSMQSESQARALHEQELRAQAQARAKSAMKTLDESSWETAFAEQMQNSETDTKIASNTGGHESITARPASPTQVQNNQDADLLSRTAKELLQNVSHDMTTNSKMRESSFMGLMKKLRDKSVIVEGNNMVDAQQHQGSSVSSQMNEALARAPQSSLQPVSSTCLTPLSLHEGALDASLARSSSHHARHELASVDDLQAIYDEMNAAMDADVAQRNRQKQRAFVGDATFYEDSGDELEDQYLRSKTDVSDAAMEQDWSLDDALLRSGPAPPTMSQMLQMTPQQHEWAYFQDQWDAHDAIERGMTPKSAAAGYPFHQRNPYLLNHDAANFPQNTLLAKEADAQRNPLNPRAWLNLGLKQQENEREALAVQALRRAVQLDPTLKEAWLALAISYTNDGLTAEAHRAMQSWTECKSEYSSLVQQFRALHADSVDVNASNAERHVFLTKLLVEMARAGTGQAHQIDAEVQIALGVMFNASEEYEKAADCFIAALSVKPDDPHLYNRIGATLANSGKADIAIDYYHRALELQPEFTRASFNLAIACMGMSEYRDAGQHLLDALAMQQSTDADVQEPMRQIGSEQGQNEPSTLLWETLGTCCHALGRGDLATACDQRNLSPFYTLNGGHSVFSI